MNNSTEQVSLLRCTTIALTQLHRLLQQATDILADLHSLFLLHTGQVDQHFQRSFPPLPPPPSFTIPLPSPTSSYNSAPVHRHSPAPRKPTASLDSSSPSPLPQPPQPKKRCEPAPPLNSQADWDAWDGDANCRLVELKTDTHLRPKSNYVARRVGFSVEQCKACWQELQDMQRLQDTSTRPLSPPPSPITSPVISTLHILLLRRLQWRRCEPTVRAGIRNQLMTRFWVATLCDIGTFHSSFSRRAAGNNCSLIV